DPQAVLALTERLGAGVTGRNGALEQAQSAALRAWAQENPSAAAAYADAVPNEQHRNRVLQAVARAYARQDRHAAWQWAHRLDPPSSSAVSSIVAEVAAFDLDGAVDLLLGVAPPSDDLPGEFLGLYGTMHLMMLDLRAETR